jgi:hypothetical protein
VRRYTILFGLFLALMAATRLPFIPGQLYSFDEINLVYSMDKLDIRVSQPQPPGYPLFVAQMHLMRWLRFVRPESNLIALSILGSALALLALVWCGDRIFGGRTGLYAALLLAMHPSFWYAGLSSALRIQLALVSAVVAGCAWQAWKGDPRWVLRGALALGLGAGVRPEIGPLLLPLWAVGWWHSGRRAGPLAALAGSVLIWLTPLAYGSGGLSKFAQGCWEYLVGQGETTSAVFGEGTMAGLTTTVWLIVWTFSGLLFLPMLALLARGAEDRIGRARWLFFALWLGPSLLFAWTIHVADPGHVLAMLVPVSLFMGHQVSRAVSMRGTWLTPNWTWVPLLAASGAWLHDQVTHSATGEIRVLILAVSLVFAVAVRMRPGKAVLGPAYAAGLILAPCILFFIHALWAGRWYYEAPREVSAARIWSDISYGFHLSTYDHVREIVDPDDAAIRAAQRLVAERPGKSLVVWERGRTSWRKLTYYLPETPVLVLEKVRGAATSSVWKRSVQSERKSGAVEVPQGTRVVWFRSADGAVTFTDLPESGGSLELGDYSINW